MSKKIVIPKESLPNLIAGETQCFLRFRIVSEDRNRVSAWTPIFGVTPTQAWSAPDFAALQSDVTVLQGDVTNLYNISDDTFAISVVL